MRAAGAEIHHGLPSGGNAHSSCFCRYERLMPYEREHCSFQDLGFRNTADNSYQGFVGKNDGPFGNGPDIAGETYARGKLFKGLRRKYSYAAQVIDVVGEKAELVHVVDDTFQAGKNAKRPVVWILAVVKVETGELVSLTQNLVPSYHCELIKIGVQGMISAPQADYATRAVNLPEGGPRIAIYYFHRIQQPAGGRISQDRLHGFPSFLCLSKYSLNALS
jgi:hypothetical protein